MKTNAVHYHNIKVKGLNIFYCEAGPADARVSYELPQQHHVVPNFSKILP